MFPVFFASSAWAADEGEQKETPKVAYHSMSPSFVSNLQGQKKYVRCDIQLMTKGAENLEAVKLHTPALRHELLLLLGDQSSSELKTPKGKEKLRKQALKAVNKVMAELTGRNNVVKDLFFTSFFVQ